MRSFPLRKSSLLTKPWEYRTVYRHGLRLRSREFFSLHFLPNSLAENRLGISVHGVKGAVKRNRIKRIIREFFRLHPNLQEWGLPPETADASFDVVFAVRKEFRPDSPGEVAQQAELLLRAKRGKIRTEITALLKKRQLSGPLIAAATPAPHSTVPTQSARERKGEA